MKTKKLYSVLLNKYTKEFSDIPLHYVHTTLLLISCILIKETVNLNKLKNQVGIFLNSPTVQINSHYKRLTRYFLDVYVQKTLWKLILVFSIGSFLNRKEVKKEIFYLAMDGSIWQLGEYTYHVLVLSVIYRKMAIPIFWINLERKGSSTVAHRKSLLASALLLYPFLKRFTILADREYKGRVWFRYLEEQGYTYIIRLCKGDYQVEVKKYHSLLKKAKSGKLVSQEFETDFAKKLKIVISYNAQAAKESEKFVILLTNKHRLTKEKISAIYYLRWKIECLFRHLKTNGFHLEELGMVNPRKIRVLMALVIASFLLCILEGVKTKQRVKKDNESFYESIFRIGYGKVVFYATSLEKIIKIITQLSQKTKTQNTT